VNTSQPEGQTYNVCPLCARPWPCKDRCTLVLEDKRLVADMGSYGFIVAYPDAFRLIRRPQPE
jgi:hypothetical protein